MTVWAIEIPPAASADPSSAVTVRADDPGGPAVDDARLAWDRVIDHALIPWANGQVEVDDDLLPPTFDSIRTAVRIVRRLRDAGRPAPTDVLPSGNGGVLFENRVGRASDQIEVLRDGSAEFSRYDENGFVDAQRLPASTFA